MWQLDFTALTETGDFYVIDPTTNQRSEDFSIGTSAYREVLEQALRMYFYQRCGVAKATPAAHPNWADPACHVGAQQDRDCRFVLNTSPSASRDLSGGWHDAGDYNKYVNYADDALHDLLHAFEVDTDAWTDDFDLPESNNGIPDLLDEIKVELDWLLKMQNADGSVLHKLAVTTFNAASPPSADANLRRYAPPTASATISACGVFAHGAFVFALHPATTAYAAQLEAAAQRAWAWLDANPQQIPSSYNNAGFVNAAAEDSAYDQEINRVRAAVHLFRRSGDNRYKTWVESNYRKAHLFLWQWAAPWEHRYQQAFLAYADLPQATPAVVVDIRSTYQTAMRSAGNLGVLLAQTDPYRAHLDDQDYTWGNNSTKALRALTFMAMVRYGLDLPNAAVYRDGAAGYLHYLHGVNPTGFSFLSNMAAAGAGQSVPEMYHAWFDDGTVWDNANTSLYGPAPGYVVGGVNPNYKPDPAYSGPPIAPPQNQPVQKSFRAWNTGWPENSWEVTECHIPYQSSYLHLLAELALGAPTRIGLDAPQLLDGAQVTFSVGGVDPGQIIGVFASFTPGQLVFGGPVLCLDLNVGLPAGLPLHLLFAAFARPDGTASWTITVPPGTAGAPFKFQAAQVLTCPYPVQSAVRPGN